jgi:DNA-binding ferritin-like protein
MGQDSIHALWVDPLTFEPSENGAPYLPESKSRTASMGDGVLETLLLGMPEDAEVGELGALVALLRAAALVHQSHHWQTRGASQYGDHLLFERVYNESVGFVDQIAERAVGTGGESLVGAGVQARLIPGLVAHWCQYGASPDPLEMVATSLEIERCVLDCLEVARGRLEEKGALSSGTDNLLQGVADKHEEFVYLLQQRGGGREAYSYDSRNQNG